MTLNSLIPLLNVQDIDRSLGFWRDVLGFEVVASFAEDGRLAWARIARGAVQLMLNRRGTDPGPRLARTPYHDAVLYFAVDDVHALVRQLRTSGVQVDDPESQEYGLDEISLRDPDGYELAFTSPTDLSARR
jgi:catechol 2,3-dioxygenase-like lactoylglutathione lyase family enzyme